MVHLSDLLDWTQARIGSKVVMRERFGSMLEHFAPTIPFPIIKVAGTNGKGSVSAMLAACLTESGLKTGLFTSPHLLSPTERFRIGHQEISEDELNGLALSLSRELRAWVQQKGEAYTPSFFEALILIALRYFSRHNVDIAIFEAGVGGENDAVSLLPDFFALLSTIGLDHQAQLGNTLEAIAKDKAGILKGGTLIFNAKIDEQLKNVIVQRARHQGVEARVSGNWIAPLADTSRVRIRIGDFQTEVIPALKGAFQQENMNLVISACLFLQEKTLLDSWDWVKGLEKACWPGRFEKIGQQPSWIIDAAHNESGLRALVQALNHFSNKKERLLIYGNSEEKDYPALLNLVPELSQKAYLVDDFYKAVPKEALLRGLSPDVRILVPGSLPLALAHAKKNFPDQLIIVTGSIFMIGKARKWILQHGLD